MPYEWTHRQPLTRLGGEDVQPGDTFTPTEAERASFSDAITETTSGEGEDDGADANSGETSAESGAEDTPLVEKHWRTAVSEVEDGEHDDRLGELAENDDLTDSVREAVRERQAELESE